MGAGTAAAGDHRLGKDWDQDSVYLHICRTSSIPSVTERSEPDAAWVADGNGRGLSLLLDYYGKAEQDDSGAPLSDGVVPFPTCWYDNADDQIWVTCTSWDSGDHFPP